MITVVEETGSTNADLVARLTQGEAIPEGFWLRAKRQSGGRGRSGREWVSPEGNLYASTVVNVRAGDPPPQTLALAVGLAVHGVVAQALQPGQRGGASLKWPNDVLVDGAKVAGILLERAGHTIVVGIGINVAFAPQIAGRDTACLLALNSRFEAAPGGLLEHILAPALHDELWRWRSDGLPRLIERWSAAAHPIGAPVSVNPGSGEPIVGTFAGLDSDGAFKLRLANGSVQTIHAGDVSLIAEGKP